jgi:hypothetical protein
MLLSLLSVMLLRTLGGEEEEEEGKGSVDTGYAQAPTSAGMAARGEEETEDEDRGLEYTLGRNSTAGWSHRQSLRRHEGSLLLPNALGAIEDRSHRVMTPALSAAMMQHRMPCRKLSVFLLPNTLSLPPARAILDRVGAGAGCVWVCAVCGRRMGTRATTGQPPMEEDHGSALTSHAVEVLRAIEGNRGQ